MVETKKKKNVWTHPEPFLPPVKCKYFFKNIFKVACACFNAFLHTWLTDVAPLPDRKG